MYRGRASVHTHMPNTEVLYLNFIIIIIIHDYKITIKKKIPRDQILKARRRRCYNIIDARRDYARERGLKITLPRGPRCAPRVRTMAGGGVEGKKITFTDRYAR